MSLEVLIPPKWAATATARSSELRMTTGADTLALDLFCDGSFKRKPPRAGIAVVANIWLPRKTTKQRTSKSCYIPCGFGGDDNNNTTEAFALAEGVHVALEHVSRIKNQTPPGCRPTDKIKIIFWSDSQTVLAALEDPRRALSPSKMRHVLDIIRLKTRELHESSTDVSVQFCWCPEECVEPHATADRLSKVARRSGSGGLSKALTLFHGVPHKAILSALNSPHHISPAITTATQPSSGGGSSSVATNAAEPSVLATASLTTPNHASFRTPQHPALARDPALETIIKDPVMLNVLYRAAGSSRFFSIVSGMVECLPSNLRSSMQEAILEQRELNKTYDCLAKALFNGREQNHQLSSSSRYPNLFFIIEIAAWKLPADHRDKALTAIKLQKEANAHLVQDEVEGQVYQFEDSDTGDVDHEPEAFEEPEALVDTMDIEESEMSKESTRIIEEPDFLEETAKTIQGPGESDTEELDELIDLDRAEVLDEHNIINELQAGAEPIDIIQTPRDPEEEQLIREPEPFEEARPNRMRAVWAWFERKLTRL